MNNNIAEQVILDAALQVVAEKSIIGTRLHLIAQKAGMAQSNLHYYYRTKHDLLVALFKRIQDGFEADREVRLGKEYRNFDKRLQVYFDQKKHIITEDPAIDYAQFDYWSQGRSDPEIKQLFYQSYEVWRQEMVDSIHQFYPDIDDEEMRSIARVMVSMMMGGSMQYLNAVEPFDLDAYFAQCSEMILRQVESLEAKGAAARNG